MFKVVLFNNNIEFIKILCNRVLNEIPDIQISGICTSLEEFNYLIQKVNPDIIMMNHSDFVHNKIKFKKSKILFGNASKSVKSSLTQLIINKDSSKKDFIRSINNFLLTKRKESLRQRILEELEPFHFNFKLIGTTYIIECIIYCYENKSDYVFENLEKNVYPIVAKSCKSTPLRVKSGIIRSIDFMNNNITLEDQKLLSKSLKVDMYEKTTAKQLISTIVTKLN